MKLSAHVFFIEGASPFKLNPQESPPIEVLRDEIGASPITAESNCSEPVIRQNG
jgi:hypothetical protein